LHPIADMMFVDFIADAMTQLVNQGSKLHYISGGQVKVPLLVRAAMGSARGAAAHHSSCLYPWFMHVPGLKVVTYSNPTDGYGLVRTALRDPNPVVFLDHKALFASKGDAPAEDTVIPFGEARVCREGKDLTLVAVAMMVPRALEATEQLASEVSVEVIDPRTLVPLDTASIFASVEKTGRLLIVDESYPTCSFASEVAAIVARERLYDLDAPIRTLNAKAIPHPLSPPLEEAMIPQVADIVASIRALMED
jgi:acetoin:2,6-dichlorophenolindophenol oxidoreductase subunit beta